MASLRDIFGPGVGGSLPVRTARGERDEVSSDRWGSGAVAKEVSLPCRWTHRGRTPGTGVVVRRQDPH